MMKRILTLALFALATLARASEFTFKANDVPDLIGALRALDGYDRAVDQGPGNHPLVIRENYKFDRAVRAKLGANLTVLQGAQKKLAEQFDALRLEISGNPQAIDDKDPIQVKLWNRRAAEILAKPITLDLSTVTNDDLKPGSGDGENPIPISVISILNLLRPAPAK